MASCSLVKHVTSIQLLLIILTCHTCPAQQQADDGLSLVVEEVHATTATISWLQVLDNITVSVILRYGESNTTWNDNEGSRRILTDLKEYTQYTVCVIGHHRDVNSTDVEEEETSVKFPEECKTFKTSFTMRSVAAFGCSTFLLLSFGVVTILDFLYGSVRPNEEQQKQHELLEEGAKTFKRKKAKKRRKKKGAVGNEEELLDSKEARDSIVDQLLRDSGLDQVADSVADSAAGVHFDETPSVRDSVLTDDGSLTMADLAASN